MLPALTPLVTGALTKLRTSYQDQASRRAQLDEQLCDARQMLEQTALAQADLHKALDQVIHCSRSLISSYCTMGTVATTTAQKSAAQVYECPGVRVLK